MAPTRGTLALSLTLLSAACSGSPAASGPLPVSMSPSQATGVAPVEVTISGQRFDAASRTDFAKGSATLDATFQARLLPEAGGDPVTLDAVRLTEQRQLAAIVPTGIPRGTFTLEVTGPDGKTGLLAQAFRVVTSAESVAAFRVVPSETAHAGVPFLVSLTAVDASGAVVDGFNGSVDLADLTGSTVPPGTVTPTTAGPFSFGRLSVRLTVADVASADQLTAVDAMGHVGVSGPFEVLAGPAVALAFASAPTSVNGGACSPAVALELRDALGHATTSAGTVTVLLQSSPAGTLAFFGDSGCSGSITAASISAGSTGTRFHFRGTASGPVGIRAAPGTLPSVTQTVTIAP